MRVAVVDSPRRTVHEYLGASNVQCIYWAGMVMYPERAPTGYTWSPEPEIAKKHFGFEFWLTVALFLFLAGMIIAQWFFSALVKPVETPGAIYSPTHDHAR